MRIGHFAIASLVLFVILIVVACEQENTKTVNGTVESADNVSIYYEVRGQGNTSLVFVHCWSCDHEFWRHQVDNFDDQYQVVTLDLAGHGKSGADRNTWTITGLAKDVVAVAVKLELKRIILIGQSMGGPVSLEVARLLPNRVIGIVAADTLQDAEYEFPPEQAEQMITAFESDFVGTLTDMFSNASGTLIDAELREWIINKGTGARPEVAIALLSDFAKLNLPKMFLDAGVPIRAINATPAPMIPKTNIEVNRKYSDYDAVIMEGVGHFLHIESPERFNNHLSSYIIELDKT